MTTGRVLAIVTARGGSKGFPGKNLARLNGISLVGHSIKAGIDCPAVHRVVLTTDDPAIARIGHQYGAMVVDRPAVLATDTARSEDAVRHVLETLEAAKERFDLLVLLQPTSPLRTAAHLSDCLERFAASGAACAISVTETAHPPHKAFVLADGWLEPLFSREMLSCPRQLLPRTYRPNGAIYVIGCERFLKANSFYIEPAMPYVMDSRVSVDIDSPEELEWANFLMTRSPCRGDEK